MYVVISSLKNNNPSLYLFSRKQLNEFFVLACMNRKKRRHSGWITPTLTISKKQLIENDLFVNPEYSDWDDYRDGLRDWSDYKKIKRLPRVSGKRLLMNKKQQKLLLRRKVRKMVTETKK